MRTKHAAGLALATALLPVIGCASDPDEIAHRFIAEMDALPPEERVPNWDETRALMMREAPAVGDMAPDFELETQDGSETVRLSAFRRQVPVVLVFGSWT